MAAVALLGLAVPAHAQMGGGQGAAPADTTRHVWVVPGERAGPSAFPLTNYPEVQPKVPGQLDWQYNGVERAIECGVEPDRVINTRSADELLVWTGS